MGRAELRVAAAFVARLDWGGRVLTGDALFCQRALCRQVLATGNPDLLVVKANQPALHRDLELLFDPPAADPGDPPLDRRVSSARPWPWSTVDATRHLVASKPRHGPPALAAFR